MPTFTPAQLSAIDPTNRHLDACVVAGPGSGKTTVLVEHFRRLVEAGVDPLRILAITFTEKAAGNMRKKLAAAFETAPATRAALERAWVSTVHGFCARLLRDNAVFAGIDPEFQVADERLSWRMQQDSMTAAMESLFHDDPAGVRALIRALSSFDFEESVLNAYDAMRGAGVRVDDLAAFPAPTGVALADVAATLNTIRNTRLTGWSEPQRQHCEDALEAVERILSAPNPRAALDAIAAVSIKLPQCKRGAPTTELLKHLRDVQLKGLLYTLITDHYAPQRAFLIEILRRFDAVYRDRKRQAGVLDFSDLEEFTARLLEDDPAVRDRLQQQFEHILMDEFQDTNGQQARLLSLVRAPGRFYAVGDINQSIFGFRHAEPQGFATYRDDVERTAGRLIELTDNFRSRPDILRAVDAVLSGQPGIVPRPLVAGRQFDHDRPLCVEAVYVIPGEEEEAQWVARRIVELLDAEPRFTFQDVAILVRNTEVFAAFTTAFETAGIPYVVNRGRGFYDSREVNDLTQLLRVIANPRDELALAAVLRSPLVGVSDEALLALRMLDANLGAALLDRAAPSDFSAADWAALSRFRDRLRGWRAGREHVTFDRLLLAAIDDTGYRPDSGPRGDANIEKFLAQARDAAARMSLDDFVEELAMVREANPREPDAPPEDSADAVKLMTVHSAKGLEFPIVFVAALHKGIENKLPVVAFSPALGLGARWRMPAVREDKDDLFQHAIRAERKQREEEESNRLLYVAMTRAEEHLVLSFSGERQNNWAKLVVEALALDITTPRDEIETRDGFALRVLIADTPPALLPTTSVETAPAEVELLPRPAIADQYDSGVTVTALSRSLSRDTFPRAPIGRSAAADLGTEVHDLLAGLADTASPEAVRLADTFRRSPLAARLATATRIEREFDFVLALEDVVVHGQIDLWFEDAGKLIIVDYKTDNVTGPEAHQRARDYAAQLRLYALAVERVAGRPVDAAWLHFLRPDKLIAVDLRPSLLDSPEQLVRDFRDAQELERCAHMPM
jgi:ATP-dependent helicase/nuclease subunit A